MPLTAFILLIRFGTTGSIRITGDEIASLTSGADWLFVKVLPAERVLIKPRAEAASFVLIILVNPTQLTELAIAVLTSIAAVQRDVIIVT